jgi:NADPH-dependent 2,4-dienoyl-CoA reductase/sulfur reductase-like enzyme
MAQLHYSRQLPIEEGFDLIVAGGGPSGVAAAVAAGRMGPRVALIEQTGCLGGLGTGGIGIEFAEALYACRFLPADVSPEHWRKAQRRGLPFNGEGLKLLMDEFVAGAGVEIRFFSSLIDVVVEGREISAIVVSGKADGKTRS